MRRYSFRVNLTIPFIFLITFAGCHSPQPSELKLIRFDRMIFSVDADTLARYIRNQYPEISPFLDLYNEYVLRIGPDTLPDYASTLRRFTDDPVMIEAHRLTDSVYPDQIFHQKILGRALATYSGWKHKKPPVVVTYPSGFNQAFVALPGILGIGLDQYLGADQSYYVDLGIPKYIRDYRNPENLVPDALRAWILSDLRPPQPGSNLITQMIYHGKVLYLLTRLLPGPYKEMIFRYSSEQFNWLESHEKAMWQFLAEEKYLFSTDRMTIRRMVEEAPFIREFGSDSPGRCGEWIGYRIIKQYVRHTHISIPGLLAQQSVTEILDRSGYRP
ncbi:MAG: hypothetical protein J7L89_05170 [Bacteroidales bacterium]|nr:hypothetical protein [Bacteroidales bacterium]